MQIRRDLQSMRKGNVTMIDYLQDAKQLADSLAASGQPMAESDHHQVILSGLDVAYDAITNSLTTTLEHIPMDDFQAHLLAFESRLQSHNLTQWPRLILQRILSTLFTALLSSHSNVHRKRDCCIEGQRTCANAALGPHA